MKRVHMSMAIAAAVCTLASCALAGETGASVAAAGRDGPQSAPLDDETATRLLEAAELERRDGYAPGSGLAESAALEGAGDCAGAVLAAYKDILYAKGAGLLADGGVDACLRDIRAASARAYGPGDERTAAVDGALGAVEAFESGEWIRARDAFAAMARGDGEYDSMAAWLRVSAALESGCPDGEDLSRYSAMQSRYCAFAVYWLRAARFGGSPTLKRDAAERCALLAPEGPYAAEARSIIARSYELPEGSGGAMLLPKEADAILLSASSTGAFEILERLFPLLSLSDNPATFHALDGLKRLARDGRARAWVLAKADSSEGRLAERLRYAAGR